MLYVVIMKDQMGPDKQLIIPQRGYCLLDEHRGSADIVVPDNWSVIGDME